MKRKIRRKIEKKGPLTGKEICKALPEVNESTLRGHLAEMRGRSLLTLPKYEEGTGWVYLHFLEDQKKEALEKSGYMPRDKIEEWLRFHLPKANRIRSVIKELRLKLQRDPTLEEITNQLKEPREKQQLQDLIYRVGKGMHPEWSEATEDEIKEGNARVKKILAKAAWDESALDLELEKRKWKRKSVREVSFEGGKRIWVSDSSLRDDADKYKENFPQLVPNVEVVDDDDKWIYDFRWRDVEKQFKEKKIGEIWESLMESSERIGVFESVENKIVLRTERPIETRELEDLFQKLENRPLQEEMYIGEIRSICKHRSPFPRNTFPRNKEAFDYIFKKLQSIFWNFREELHNYEHRLFIFESLSNLILTNTDKREIAVELGYLDSNYEENFTDFFADAFEMEEGEEERIDEEIKERSLQALGALTYDEGKRVNQLFDLFEKLPEDEAEGYEVDFQKILRRLSSGANEKRLRKKMTELYRQEKGKKKKWIKKWLNDDRIF